MLSPRGFTLVSLVFNKVKQICVFSFIHPFYILSFSLEFVNVHGFKIYSKHVHTHRPGPSWLHLIEIFWMCYMGSSQQTLSQTTLSLHPPLCFQNFRLLWFCKEHHWNGDGNYTEFVDHLWYHVHFYKN